MHNLFGEWYRRATIDPRATNLPARWSAIEAITKKIDETKILEFVRCFLDLPLSEPSPLEEFRKELLAADPAFPVRNNKVEMQVLCGAALVSIIEPNGKLSDFAAMALQAASAPGLRKPALVPEIIRITDQHLFDRSATVRQFSTSRQSFTVNRYGELIEAVKAACATNSAVNVSAPLEKVLATVGEAVNKIATIAEGAITSLEKAERVLAEESNMGWWVFSEYSRDTAKPFEGMELGYACLQAGKELADLTTITPAPRAAAAYLDKLLGLHGTSKLTLVNVLEKVPSDWSKVVQAVQPKVLDVCPLSFSLVETSRGHKPAEAASIGRKRFGLTSAGVLPLNYALQFYRERLLMKNVK